MTLRSDWPTNGALAVCCALIALTIAGCGFGDSDNPHDSAGQPSPGVQTPCAASAGFALSHASYAGGQPSPLAAATWFVAHGGIASLPQQGWYVVELDRGAATVRSGSSTVHVLRGHDRTWQVDSGTHCL